MATIHIDQAKCSGCRACIEVCTGNVFALRDEQVQAVDARKCWGCGQCVAHCAKDSIEHDRFPLADCPPLAKDDPAFDTLVMALRARRSTRNFREAAVPREVVRQLVDASRWAPSAENEQPVDWVAFDDREGIDRLSAGVVDALAGTARLLRNPVIRVAARLRYGAAKVKAGVASIRGFEALARRRAAGEDPIFYRAPLVLVGHTPRGDYFGRDDTVYAAYNLMLAADRLGLGTCQIGYLLVALEQSRALVSTLGLPPGRRAQLALAVGYPRFKARRALVRRQPELSWR